MSDPVKNAEVEDVLSSIRRLVSEDKRPLQTAPKAAPSPVVDRLVLTPALRVQDDIAVDQASDPTPDQISDQAVDHSEPEVVTEAVQADTSDQDIARLNDQAPENDAQDDQSTQSKVSDGHNADSQDTNGLDTDSQDEDELDTLLHDTSDPAQDAADVDQHVRALSENYADDPYNFGDAQDKDGDTSSALLLTNPTTSAAEQNQAQPETPAEDVAETVIEVADTSQDGAQESSVVEAVLAAEQKGGPDTLSEKIAALETAIGGISDQWEPDAAGQDAYAGSEPETMAWEDDIAQEDSAKGISPTESVEDMVDVTEAAEATHGDAAIADAPDGTSDDESAGEDNDDDVTGFSLGADDQLLDEETLREMINEIVHSELQGALGERITRNVRRLVRREIHRALTARDLG